MSKGKKNRRTTRNPVPPAPFLPFIFLILPLFPCSAATATLGAIQPWAPVALFLVTLEALVILSLYAKNRKLSGVKNTLQNILDASRTVAIIATDKDGEITLFNAGAERMLGYQATEVIGKLSPMRFHVPEELETRQRELSERFDRPIRGIEIFTAEANETGHEEREWTYVRKDGTRFPGYLAVTPIMNGQGRITGMLGVTLDISGPKRAEEELVREKALIEAIFNSVPGMLYLYDYDGGIVRWNRKHETMTGYTTEEMSRMRLMDWYEGDEKSQNAVQEGLKATLETGFGDAEANLRRKDGSRIPMYFTASPMTLFGKQYFVGLGIDITARRRAERLMRIRLDLIEFSETHTFDELLRKTLDEVTEVSGSQIGFYHFVAEDQKTLSLQAWSTRTLKEFCVARDYDQHYSIDKAGVWVDCVRERRPVVHNDYASLPHRKGLPEGHAPVIRELTVPVVKDEKIVAILGVGNKASDYTDDDIQTVSFLADVTWEIVAKQRAMKALRESETKLSTLFEAMTEMVALHELVFDETGTVINYRIVDCNKAYTRITGIRREDAVGRLANEVYGTSDPPYLREFSNVGITGEPYLYETYFPPMDKHFSISVVSPGKNRFATVTTDVSEIKRIQAAIDAKNKELEQIVYVASHDLRSPLVNVDGYSRELEISLKEIISRLGEAGGNPDASLRAEFDDMEKSLGRIRISASQMDKLLKGLLHLSRQGRAALKIEDIDMNACVARLVASFAYTLEEKHAELTIEDLPPCRGDEVQLTQVFSNLINNAIKYRDPSRPLEIVVTGSTMADRAVYRVEDNGIGIAENHLEHVFELFHRLNPEKTDGEGIGLTIARQALARMYGEIRVESELGKGSSFIVTLPSVRARSSRQKE